MTSQRLKGACANRFSLSRPSKQPFNYYYKAAIIVRITQVILQQENMSIFFNQASPEIIKRLQNTNHIHQVKILPFCDEKSDNLRLGQNCSQDTSNEQAGVAYIWQDLLL